MESISGGDGEKRGGEKGVIMAGISQLSDSVEWNCTTSDILRIILMPCHVHKLLDESHFQGYVKLPRDV